MFLRSSLSLIALFAALAATAPARAQMPPCANELMPLRQAVEKDGLAVKAAIEKKTDRAEVCNALKRFTAAEAKFIKFLQDNQGWCGIPQDAINQVKAGHAHSTKLRGQACAAGPVGGRPGPPPGPGLSDALGTSRAPTPQTAKPGGGTYDTLMGSPFKQ
jgi:hypothetical protein